MDDIFSEDLDLDDDILGEILGTSKSLKTAAKKAPSASSGVPSPATATTKHQEDDDIDAPVSRPATAVSQDTAESSSPAKSRSEDLGMGFVPSFFDTKPRQRRFVRTTRQTYSLS